MLIARRAANTTTESRRLSSTDRVIVSFLVLVFGYAGLDKLAHFSGFVTAIDSYRFFPIPLGWLVAPFVIAAELTVAVGLMEARWRRAAALQAAILVLAFSLALALNEALGGEKVCGCWFSLNLAPGHLHLALNGLLFLLSLAIWHASDFRPGKPGPPTQGY